jgi:hypothetical protein
MINYFLALGEEAEFGALNYQKALNLNRRTKLHLTTETASMPNACYLFALPFLSIEI